MHCYICIYGCMVISAVAFLTGVNLGGLVVWAVNSHMPRAGLKDRTWWEVDH